MRYLLLTVLVFAVVISASAKEIELSTGFINSNPTSILSNLSPVFAGKGETTLQQSDDSADGTYTSNGFGRAQWFTAPSDCHIISTSFYYRYGNCDKDITIWEHDGTNLPGTVLGSVSHTFTNQSNEAWQDPYTDLTSLGITMTSGTLFWAGFPRSSGSYTFYTYTDKTDPDYGYCYENSSGWSWDFNDDQMLRVVINDDMDGPVAAAQDPADGDSGVSVDTDILFDIDDADIGVDSGTIVDGSVTVDQDIPTKGKIDVPGLLTYDDTDPNNVHVTFNPDSDFEEGAIVTVTVSPAGTKITDDLGNEMAEDSWTFDIIPSGVEAASLGTIKAEFK